MGVTPCRQNCLALPKPNSNVAPLHRQARIEHPQGWKPSVTAQFAAAMRVAAPKAVRTQDRLFEDPYAALFVQDPTLRTLMSRPWLIKTVGRLIDRYYAGLIGEAVLRNRYADDVLEEAMSEGVDQVVLLGAGYDSTALRYAGADVRFFEVDQADTQRQKRRILEEHEESALAEISFVSCDLLAEDLAEALVGHGYDPARRALVTWLAVSFYLPEAAVERTMAALAELLAPGSRIVFNYLHRDVIDGGTASAGARRARRAVAKRGEPWLFGMDPVELSTWLARHGFEATDHLTGAELGRRYFGEAPPAAIADYISLVTAEPRGKR